jgi:hypothetical protein
MQPRSPLLRLLFRVCVRLGLGLALLVGLCGMLAGVSLHAHAAPAATLTVTDCSGETGPGRIGTVIGSASALDTITFSCSGTIPITSTLTISKNLTLDGSGQSVTLDGGNSVRVLSVNSGVTFTLNALTIAHGSAGGGGGLADITSTVSISNSTFANNSSPGGGGGLFNVGGTVSISNSTFANNSANNVGGGLLTETGGTVSISNSTFANNSAGGGGGLSEIASNMSVGGSIVANNSGGNCFGPVLDQGYNLESGTDCGFTGTSDLQNTDPKLDPNGLQNNGGPTQTLALEPDSAAVDQIPTGSSCPATDQRGVSRPQGPACDIGAFEMTAADGVTVMIHVVNSFHLTRSLQTTLDNKLQDVLAAINGGQTATACSDLSDFIGFVQSHIGKGLTSAQATQLVNEATVIKTRLGC